MFPPAQTRPEPMNSSLHHPKVKVSMILAHPIYVAGKFVAGKMEVECRADKGLGINVIMVELFAMQELMSRDHSATSTFLHSRRLFQGPDLPPSNAVQTHPQPGDPSYPPQYHQARRGTSTFLFRIPLPPSAPSSINFGSGLARVRYELRATAEVVWKGVKTLVVCKREIDVVESFQHFTRMMPEGVVVGEFGKIWVQGSILGGVVIAGESACLKLQIRNHSNKKNTGLTLSLTQLLVLPGLKSGENLPLRISDNLVTVSFGGPEYIVGPGAEGVASLVFDVPQHARAVRPGPYEGDESENRTSESIFEVRGILGITINMGFEAEDIHLDIVVPIVHPDAIPEPAESMVYFPLELPPSHLQSPCAQSRLHMLPYIPAAYIDSVSNQVWSSPPSHTPHIYDTGYLSFLVKDAQNNYHSISPQHVDTFACVPARPMGAGSMDQFLPSCLGGIGAGPMPSPSQSPPASFVDTEPEEGKGERATRITQHLRMSSRYRSVSPQSHRFPLPVSPVAATQIPLPIPPLWTEQLNPELDQLPQSSASAFPAAPIPELLVRSPRAFLSPKWPIDNFLSKSDRVKELERMVEEVEKTSVIVPSDLPKTTFKTLELEPVSANSSANSEMQWSSVVESDLNKTPLAPPSVSNKAKDKGVAKSSGRTRIDEFFASAYPILTESPKTPKTPMTAVTPVKPPSKTKSADFKAQLSPNEQAESGLDALERRLLAEIGTSKMDLANERGLMEGVIATRPIDIPSKESKYKDLDDPWNESAISSLTLAGKGIWIDREDVVLSEVLDVDAEEHDWDEKTHRAGKSIASAGSKKGSRGAINKGKKKGKKDKDKDKTHDRGRDGERCHTLTRKKKTTAAKGRVAAWLGAIDPDVPPEEDVLPPSPAVSRNIHPFMEGKGVPPPVIDDDVASLENKPLNDVDLEDSPNNVISAPNSRSSGFVPIGLSQTGIFHEPLGPLPKDVVVVREAQHVAADTWLVPAWAPTAGAPNNKHCSEALMDVPPSLLTKDVPSPSSSPALQTSSSNRINLKETPPSVAGAVDVLGNEHRNINARKGLDANMKVSNWNEAVPASSRLAVLSTPRRNSEVEYNMRAAREDRGGRVAAISSLWPIGAACPSKGIPVSSKPLQNHAPRTVTKDFLATPSNPVRNHVPDTVTKDSLADTNLSVAQSSVKLHLTPTTATIIPPNLGPVDVAGKRPPPIIKSTSVPAIVSSSHATVSLVHPTSATPHSEGTLPPTISEVQRLSEQASAEIAVSSSKPGPGEIVFGQARLRELIKKYQGQAA